MRTVYLVVRHIPYEGDTVIRVYDNREDADEYAKILEKEDLEGSPSSFGYWEYKVEEEKVYSKEPAWSLANDDHR